MGELPDGVLVKLEEYLSLKSSLNFSQVNKRFNHIFKKNNSDRLVPIEKIFNTLMDGLQYEKLAYSIVQDLTCKKILLQRPKNLPHWILSLAEYQPALIKYILKDSEYRDTLTKSECSYLIKNYPHLKDFFEDYPEEISEKKSRYSPR